MRPTIGFDYGMGFQYRPPLSDNWVIVGGFTGLKFGRGLKDIFEERSHAYALFGNIRFLF